MPDDASLGLVVPGVFWGLPETDQAMPALRMLAQMEGVGDPRHPWFLADNLLTYGHSRGFLQEPQFVGAVLAAAPQREELAVVWRTHTLCWAAQSCRDLPGDFVECGTYRGYSAEVIVRFMAGLPGRSLWLYDLFDVSGAPGEGHRLPAHAADLVEQVRARFRQWQNVQVVQGKVPPILDAIAPEHIAFLHIDMNNAEAELGAMQRLFDRVSPGGIIIFDDYGWTGYRDQKQAADEFMQQHGLSVLELPTGQGMVLKR